ncbi:ATP-dependent DNA helicase PcrA [Candidatus Roizmanbacteria bacterium CG_4_8_14_3_um_filter_36_12]|nr:MAG: ATP-dependent DNA helicase PcrA [Candidatus Roizmanbacteria bacterium CG_4_8_14_3_um_filter_36_12]
MSTDILVHLNTQQKEAVFYRQGSSIILAGAGSGKTRVLVAKVINLIKNHRANPKSILMITFTNKAASEMKARIGLSYSLGYVGTFHSFCARVLRIDGQFSGLKKNFLIYDEEDQIALIKSVLKKTQLNKKYTPSYFLNRISSAKNQLIGPEKYLEVFSDHASADTATVYQGYQKELKENNALDFNDLINMTIKLFTKNKQILDKYQEKYRHILVDEFQDTNYVQYLLTKLLGEKYKNITVVGDFSQSIYSWRGAEIKNLEKFKKDFPKTKVFYLEKNYRSSQTILDFAYQVISKNQTHPILSLYTDKKGGEEVTFYEAVTEEDEGIYIANSINDLKKKYRLDEMAVLYRINAQSRAIEEVFLHFGIHYVLIGGTRFYERKEIKDILSYLRLLINPVDRLSKERIIKLGKSRWEKFKKYYEENKESVVNKNTDKMIEEIFQVTDYLKMYDPEQEEDYSCLENIKELKSVAIAFPSLGEFLEQVALVESEYFEGEKNSNNKNGVRLMTLHQAKGLEFPIVFVVGVEDGILPHSRSIDDIYSLEEERRLFYVGITRAKERLYITYTRQRFIFGQRNYSVKSRFLEE